MIEPGRATAHGPRSGRRTSTATGKTRASPAKAKRAGRRRSRTRVRSRYSGAWHPARMWRSPDLRRLGTWPVVVRSSQCRDFLHADAGSQWQARVFVATTPSSGHVPISGFRRSAISRRRATSFPISVRGTPGDVFDFARAAWRMASSMRLLHCANTWGSFFR